MYLLGQLEHGVYAECPPYDDHLEEEEVTQRVERQLNHKSIDVPRIQDPFAGREDDRVVFCETLAYAADENLVPTGYGFLPDEDGFGEWLEVEKVAVGKRRRGKQWKVTLPQRIWEPRAKAWVQAVEGLAQMI